MGKEADRQIDDVRKKIGQAAADMLEKVRADYRKQQLENVALAREVIALRETVAAAMLAFQEPAKAYRGAIERLENLKQRAHGLDVDLMNVMAAVGTLGSQVRHAPASVAALERLRQQTLAEFLKYSEGPRRWLPWRRRRAEDLSRFLSFLVSVRQPDGMAFERADPQKVVE